MILLLWASFLSILDGNSAVVGNNFSYFTVQTNTLILVWITFAVLFHNKDQKPLILDSRIHGAIVSYISVVFIIFVIFLAPYYQPTGIEAIWNTFVHYIIPIAFIIEWFITECDIEYEWKYIAYWMIYPPAYLVYTLIRGYFTGWYPYYFVDANKLPILNLILNFIALCVSGFLIMCLYIALNRKIFKSRNK